MKYIRNGKIVMPNEILTGKALCYDCDIKGVVDENNIPAGADVIDAEGGYIAPGLVDIHIHGYLGEDASDATPDGVRKMAEGVIANGVTSFLPTTMTVPKDEILAAYENVRRLMPESKTWKGAEILGVNSEGPFINPSKKGAQAEENILAPDADMILENADIVRITTIAPEMDKSGAIVAYHFRSTYPGSYSDDAATEWIRIPAYGPRTGLPNVLHIMDSERPEQYRGVSYLAHVIEPILQTRRYTESEITAALVESYFTAFVTTNAPASDMPYNETVPGDQQEVSSGANDYEMGPGTINMMEAISESCNYYFYEVSYRLGIDRLVKWAEKLGFTSRTGIELTGETKGIIGGR